MVKRMVWVWLLFSLAEVQAALTGGAAAGQAPAAIPDASAAGGRSQRLELARVTGTMDCVGRSIRFGSES